MNPIPLKKHTNKLEASLFHNKLQNEAIMQTSQKYLGGDLSV